MRAEIQMRTGHLFLAKNLQNDDKIDIQGLLKEYWGSTEHDFIVTSQSRSPTGPSISHKEAQRPLPSENTMGV